MTDASHYIIRGGDAGARRLEVLARAMLPGTRRLLELAGLKPGMKALDLGCGGGDATREIARVVGPSGRVVAIDMDREVMRRGQAEAKDSDAAIEWRIARAEELDEHAAFDVVYARFLLSHLADPLTVLQRMMDAVRPGGRVVVEDIDISTHTHWPPSAAFHRFVELYRTTARARGADPEIGPRLPSLFLDTGLEEISVAISMPVFHEGDCKTIARITLENIAAAAIEQELTDADEIAQLCEELRGHEADPRSIQSTAQVFQCIGRRSA